MPAQTASGGTSRWRRWSAPSPQRATRCPSPSATAVGRSSVCRRDVAIPADDLGDTRETRDTPTARNGLLLSLALRCPSWGALGYLTAATDELAFDEETSGEADARLSVAA